MGKYNLTLREKDILYILWAAKKPLLASEIANGGMKIATVHTTIKRMLKKNLVVVDDFAKSGNVYGRCYRSNVDIIDFELSELVNGFMDRKSKKIKLVNLVEKFLELDDEETLKELAEIEKIIRKKRKEIG